MCEGNLVAGARTPQLRMRSLLTQHHWPGVGGGVGDGRAVVVVGRKRAPSHTAVTKVAAHSSRAEAAIGKRCGRQNFAAKILPNA